MSMATAYGAIVTRWTGQTAFGTNRRAYTDLGGPPFERPTFTAGSVTNANRKATMTGLMWCRFDIRPISGTERPQGISPDCPSRWVGVVTRSIYYPLGYGFDFLLTRLDLERAIFHRQSLASGVVQFRDCGAPEHVDLPDDRNAGWGRVDLDNEFWMTEAV